MFISSNRSMNCWRGSKSLLILHTDNGDKYSSKSFWCILERERDSPPHIFIRSSSKWCCPKNELPNCGNNTYNDVPFKDANRIMGRSYQYCCISTKLQSYSIESLMLQILRVFGCLTLVHIQETWDKAVLIGYPEGTKGYELYDLFTHSNDKRKFHDFDSGYSLKSDSHFYYPIGEDTERIVHNQPVGATYQENFMRETEHLGSKRQHRPPVRLHEPKNIREVWTGKHSVKWLIWLPMHFWALDIWLFSSSYLY